MNYFKTDETTTLEHLEDIYLYHRYCYYVLGIPELTDAEFDKMERYFKILYPYSKVFKSVGSSNENDYPSYIKEKRRPFSHERE